MMMNKNALQMRICKWNTVAYEEMFDDENFLELNLHADPLGKWHLHHFHPRPQLLDIQHT